MGIKVAKFGGSSLADAGQFQKVREIVLADPNRRYVVPSAPGKRHPQDEKITDMLYACHRVARQGGDLAAAFAPVAERYRQIIAGLGLRVDFEPVLRQAMEGIAQHEEPDYAASRGEYLNGILLADYLGIPFVDAADVIFFDAADRLDLHKTGEAMGERLSGLERAVIPGFYGRAADGRIKTFSRGGSDITGSVVSRAVGAELYENWTDVPGFLMADPRIVDHPKVIGTITYKELRELSYMGATVLHEEAIFPVRESGIPINIRDTNDPAAPGTMIVHQVEDEEAQGVVTGIAGHKGFSIIAIEKNMMNAELGFGRRILQVLEENQINFEHLPTGIDTMSVVVADKELAGKLDRVVEGIYQLCEPDSVEIMSNLAIIATVGLGMVRNPGTAARLFRALADNHINVRMIDQGSSEINIIVGVMSSDFNRAINAIYQEFVEA